MSRSLSLLRNMGKGSAFWKLLEKNYVKGEYNSKFVSPKFSYFEILKVNHFEISTKRTVTFRYTKRAAREARRARKVVGRAAAAL